MKKIFILIIVGVLGFGNISFAKQEYIDSMSTINDDLRRYFPRWKVCEPDLQYQIYQAFILLGVDKSSLDMQDVEVLASPKGPKDKYYEILLLTCGDASLNARQVDSELKTIGSYLSGRKKYDRSVKGKKKPGLRDYCFVEIPPEIPVKADQGAAIRDYLQPTNVNQALTLSMFDQSLKFGDTGYWLLSKIGNDEIGYPYWNAGESKFMLKKPLYDNDDNNTKESFPYLINLTLGGAYQINSGIDPSGVFSWISERKLNSNPNGKLIAGLDVHMPFHPEFGVHFNVEMPLSTLREEEIFSGDYASYVPYNRNISFSDLQDKRRGTVNFSDSTVGVVPILNASGQVTLFYNLWLNKRRAENYFRFDFGISYAEVNEYFLYSEQLYRDAEEGEVGNEDGMVNAGKGPATISNDGISGLNMYKPDEISDWLYAKVEYRNQAVYPFSLSMQISNQILLTRAYVPLFGTWFFLEAKYSTPLRDALPFEIENFFMISPVIRITI